jgi:hypothetical protein
MVSVPILLTNESKTQESSNWILRKIGINCNLKRSDAVELKNKATYKESSKQKFCLEPVAKNHTVQGRFQICEIGSGNEWINRKWNRRPKIWGISQTYNLGKMEFADLEWNREWRKKRKKKMNSTQCSCVHTLTIASCSLSDLVFDQLQSDGGEFFMHHA